MINIRLKKYVLDWFFTKKMVKKLDGDSLSNDDIFFNNVTFLEMKWVFFV